jgi:hypothetical protein
MAESVPPSSSQKFNAKNVWTALWFHPRLTIRRLIETRLNDPVIIWIALVYGILVGLSFFGALLTKEPIDPEWHHPLFISILLIGGIALAFIQLYFISWLYKVVGGWLKGKGSYKELKLALGWSMYPMIVANLLNGIALFLMHLPIIALFFVFLYFIALVWSLVITIAAISEAHQFSWGRGVGTILITGLLVGCVVFLIFAGVYLLSPTPT